MKRILLVVVLLSSLAAFSQTPRQYVGLSIGPSFPLDDFAKTELGDTISGFAKTGINLNLVYSYRFSYNFGVQAHFTYTSNSLDLVSLNEAGQDEFPDYSFSTTSAQPWSKGGLYVGPFFNLPIGENFSWEVRGLLGLTGGYSPEFLIRGTNTETGIKTEYFRAVSKSFGLGISAGTGFKYRLNKYVILLNADYYYSNLEFKEVTGWGWTSEDNPTGTPYNYSTKQKINGIAITAGIAYYL